MTKSPSLALRGLSLKESVTLKLNALANSMGKDGLEVCNLTAGQLPISPDASLTEALSQNLAHRASYQYAPVAGIRELREKFRGHFEDTRQVALPEHECIISLGAKHSLSLAMMALVNPGDEVILLAPYWVSYPAMVSLAGGCPVVVPSGPEENFAPSIEELEKAITPKTKALILNSPNNPTGTVYSEQWMEQLAHLLKRHPQVWAISDEIYYHLTYQGPRPNYFYQGHPELLERTIVVDGISKFLAATGLRVGFALAPKRAFEAMEKIQGHTTSGGVALIQRALLSLDFKGLAETFLGPLKENLQKNLTFLQQGLPPTPYRPRAAFYYFLDLPVEGTPGQAQEICTQILKQKAVAMVPGGDFGRPNSVRLSLTPSPEVFQRAIQKAQLYEWAQGRYRPSGPA